MYLKLIHFDPKLIISPRFKFQSQLFISKNQTFISKYQRTFHILLIHEKNLKVLTKIPRTYNAHKP